MLCSKLTGSIVTALTILDILVRFVKITKGSVQVVLD